MSKIQLFDGVSLENLPAVRVVNPYKDQILKNLGDLVCDYFELALSQGLEMETAKIPLSAVVQDICRVLELDPSETASFSDCVEVVIVPWRV